VTEREVDSPFSEAKPDAKSLHEPLEVGRNDCECVLLGVAGLESRSRNELLIDEAKGLDDGSAAPAIVTNDKLVELRLND